MVLNTRFNVKICHKTAEMLFDKPLYQTTSPISFKYKFH